MITSTVENAERAGELLATGYLHAAYAESLAELGAPRFLAHCGGWILERQIPNARHTDAMGCYPLFACQEWTRLAADLSDIGDKLVSLSLVTDPFGEFDLTDLQKCFPDAVLPFKEHFVVDLTQSPQSFVVSHHQRNVRKALSEVRVEECKAAADYLEDWTTLYATLVARHKISGLPVFSRESFAKQLRVPGIVALRAVHNEVTVGMLLWYRQQDRAYYHLGAYNERGYELGASFALFDYAIKYFAERGLAWLNLGSGAGVAADADGGLSRFKQGWSTGVRTAYFCGRIMNQKKYREILENRHITETGYFPSYRAGEFS